jgi:putative oxidoreductase
MTNIDARLTSISPAVLSLFRIVFALSYLVHATQKLFAWPVGTATTSGGLTGPAVPMGAWPFWWAGLIEIVAGLLLLTGLATRAAAFVASGEMAFAYFTQHLPNGFWPIANGGELAVLYCFGFFLLVFTGGGAFALDAMRGGRKRVRR